MKLSELAAVIEEHFQSGKNITQQYIHKLSPRLLQKCKEMELATGKSWKECLCRILQKPEPCHCGKETKWKNYRDGFNKYCCSKCAGADPAVDAKRKASNLEKWGVERPQQHLPEIHEKFKATMRTRYGAEYSALSNMLNNKAKKTNLERYGVEYAIASPEARTKSKKTLLKNYGVEHTMQSRELRDKFTATMNERYGVDHALQNKAIRKKSVETLRKNYGVSSPLQSPEIMERYVKGMLAKYGVEHNMSLAWVREKVNSTHLTKYGVSRLWKLAGDYEKFKKTMMCLYGVDHPSLSPKMRESAKRTLRRNYGAEYALQVADLHEKFYDTMSSRYGVKHAMQNLESFERQQHSACQLKEVHVGGKTFEVRGFEDKALRFLIDGCGIPAKNVKTKKAEGLISFPYAEGGKNRVYHPDMLVKIANKWTVVEVKSTYTLGVGHYETFRRVKRKAKAVEEGGKPFRLLLVLDNGECLWLDDFQNRSLKSIKQELKSLHPHQFRQL